MKITDLHTENFDLVLDNGKFLSIQDRENGLPNLFFNSLYVDNEYDNKKGYWVNENIFMSNLWVALSQNRNKDFSIKLIEESIENIKNQFAYYIKEIDYKVSKNFSKISIYIEIKINKVAYRETFYL